MLLEISGEITPERTKRRSQSKAVVDVTIDGSKVWGYKEQYCIGTWNVKSMNQGKLQVVKQVMARVNANILGIIELKWTGMGEFNSDDHYIYYCGQESLRRNGVAIIVHKRVWNAVLGCNLRKDRMISVHFQGKPFNITMVFQGKPFKPFNQYTRPFRTNTPKRCPFHYRGLEYKHRKSRNTWSNRQIWPWSTEWSRSKANKVCQENALVIANTLFQQHKRRLQTWTSPNAQHWNQIDCILCRQRWRSSI